MGDNAAAEGSASGGVAGATGVGGSDGVCERATMHVTATVGADPSRDTQKASMLVSDSRSSGMGGGRSSGAWAGGDSDRTARGKGIGSIMASSGGKPSRREVSEAGGATADGRGGAGDLGGAKAMRVTVGTVTNPFRMGQNALSSSSREDLSGTGGGHIDGTQVGGRVDRAAGRNGAGPGAGSNGVIGTSTGSPTAGAAISGSVAGGDEADNAGSGKAGAMSAGGVQAGAGVGGGTIPSGSKSTSSRLWAGGGRCKGNGAGSSKGGLAGAIIRVNGAVDNDGTWAGVMAQSGDVAGN